MRRWSLGGVVYYAGTRWAGREVELRFDPPERQLVFHSEDGTEFRRQPLREVTQEALLGDLWALYQTPGYQLRLPFTPEAERAVRLCESLAGTS